MGTLLRVLHRGNIHTIKGFNEYAVEGHGGLLIENFFTSMDSCFESLSTYCMQYSCLNALVCFTPTCPRMAKTWNDEGWVPVDDFTSFDR